MLPRIASLAIGYLFGIIQTAYIYGKMNGIDIREHGSGNAGTTNALRVLGKKAGAIVFAGDFLKCFIAIHLVQFIFKNTASDILPLIALYGATGCILGHNFPIQLGFRGGKGIACTAGLLAAFDVRIGIIALLTFLAIVIVTRYVSLGSMVIVTEFALFCIIFGQMGFYHMAQAALIELYVLGVFLAAMAIYRHRANIGRLLNGTEHKVFSKK
ncbi:MAG: glycerol-3-phosphate 1-O-acyltransferase PlsY [Lachnospiraceae bacterium]|nr:glycerol-3-phosphate 1-O-acyltransferase PlsY [Lachnospiraceae bacterium]